MDKKGDLMLLRNALREFEKEYGKPGDDQQGRQSTGRKSREGRKSRDERTSVDDDAAGDVRRRRGKTTTAAAAPASRDPIHDLGGDGGGRLPAIKRSKSRDRVVNALRASGKFSRSSADVLSNVRTRSSTVGAGSSTGNLVQSIMNQRTESTMLNPIAPPPGVGGRSPRMSRASSSSRML